MERDVDKAYADIPKVEATNDEVGAAKEVSR